MLQESQELLNAIEQGNPEAVEAGYHRFRKAVQAAWERYQQGVITVAARGLPRAMYLWVTEELPLQIRDSDRWPDVRRQLTQFIRTVQWVVEPKEET